MKLFTTTAILLSTMLTANAQSNNHTDYNGSARLLNDCNDSGSNNGTSYYGLHWALLKGWQQTDFNDSQWQNATIFSNGTIGVNNKRAYTNFTELFDNADNDAQFIWSSNVVLDNLVIVRKCVQ